MVYSNRFVACILVNGQPQQELANSSVKIAFGQEYSLRLRNKNNRRAVVKIYIDGENVSGGGYIIPANDHVDIKRHWDKDCAFKFVDLDSPEAVDAGKNGPNPDKENGLIEAHFYLEKENGYYTCPYVPWYKEEHHHHYHQQWSPFRIFGKQLNDQYRTTCDSGDDAKYSCGHIPNYGDVAPASSGFNLTDAAPTSENAKSEDIATFKRTSLPKNRTKSLERKTLTCSTSSSVPAPELRDGCTVQGGETGQRFSTTYIELENTYTTLKLFLQGYTAENVNEPVKIRKTNKDNRIDDLEAENERLRKELAELENQRLREELEKARKPKKRTSKKKSEDE